MELELAIIDVAPGAAFESQSGIQMLRPWIYGAVARPRDRRKVAAIVMHPASNFMARTSVPVVLLTFTSDQSTFPST